MKILKSILILTLFSVALTSCSSDDDGGSSFELTAANFAGNYSLNFYEDTEIETRTINGGTIVTTIESVGDTFTNSVLTLNADGTYVDKSSYRITETTTLTGNPTTTETFIVSETTTGTYTLDTVNKTVTFDGDIFNITRFRETELRLTISDTEIFNDIVTETEEEYRFTR